jgi:arginine/lysine/ornithine decarboxylase
MPDRTALTPSMPLVESLIQFARMNRVSWHMPGHAAGKSWPDWLKAALPELDVTELPLTDDLNKPTGSAQAAMQLAAGTFGAGLTRFITSGSTTALQIMLAAAVGRGGRILIPRCVHQSILHAAALLDLDICWLTPAELPDDVARFSLLPQIDASGIRSALRAHPGCRAVLVTSPDYYGTCADLAAIAAAVHESGALLLVDEAHGAHLCIAPNLLPASAMQAGADACVQSGHKTLPVLTPGAYLHISRRALSAGLLDAADLDRLIPVFQTSSPSFPIAATLDYARAWLASDGFQAVDRQLNCLEDFVGRLPAGVSCSPRSRQPWPAVRFSRDPLRLVLTGSGNSQVWPARKIAREMGDLGVDIEFADLTRMVLIPSLQQSAEAWQQLADTLCQLAACWLDTDIRSDTISARELENEWRQWLTRLPQTELQPGDALFARHKLRRIPLADAAGWISARAILPYPPGIALVWPGERLDKSRVDFLRQLLENEISITGIDQGNLWVIA